MIVRTAAIRLTGLVVLLFAASCGGTSSTTPAERVVSLETTACGHTSMTSGAGVIVEDEWVLASAHVVSGAEQVAVAGAFGEETAEIVVFSAASDLALLRVPSAEAEQVQLAAAVSEQELLLAGGGPSGVATATVIRPVEVRIDAVRSVERVSRLGYEIDTRVALGDSGGGAFDTDGNLVGVIFGRSQGTVDRSFLARHEEIRDLLAQDRVGIWSCDHDLSRLVRGDSDENLSR